MSNSFQEQGADYSLIPLNGKIPTEASWSRWCAEKRPFKDSDFHGRNAGICCGPASGVLALDIDDEVAFSTYLKEHHIQLPRTRTHKTGRGGTHYLYAYPQNGASYGNRAFKREGFDIRGIGGQIVAPGSIHPETGESYLVSDKSPIAPAPPWLLDLARIDHAPAILTPASGGTFTDFENLPVSSEIKNLIRGGLPKGERSEGMMRVLVALVRNGTTDEDIYKVFDACPIGEKYREKGATKEKWLLEEIRKARDFVDDLPVLSNDDHRAVDLIEKAPFPFDALPVPLKDFIFRAAEAHNLGPEIPGAIILSLASGAIGNTLAISPRPGWVTPLPLWLMIIGISGGGKSPIINMARRPLDVMQSKAYRQFQADCREYDKALRAGEKPGERPVLSHITASDTTVEGLSTVFRHTPRGITLINDELAGLIEGMNQYKARGNDRQFYLSLFDGIPWKIDRKKADPEFIPNPLAAILGGIQPRVLTRVFNDGAFDDGLLPRFLMVHCDDGPMKFSRKALSGEIIKPWEVMIERCFRVPLSFGEDGFIDRRILTFDDPALTLWANFHDDLGIIQPFLPEKARVFIPKFITYSLKLTGLLHAIQELSEDGGGHIRGTIREDTAAAGISLTRFFAGQAVKALSLYGKDHRETDGRLTRMIETLRKLESQVKGGHLPLNLIRDTYNEGLPGILTLTPDNRGLGAILRDMGLKTVRIHGGFYHLIWDQDRIGKIFHESAFTPKGDGADGEGEGRGGRGHGFEEKLAFTQVVTTTHSVTVTQGFLTIPEMEGGLSLQGNPGMVIDLDLSDEEIEVIE